MKNQKIRQVMGKMLGEMITVLFRERDLQDLFEQRGGIPEDMQSFSSGDIALRMGVIDPETKTALLIAQAAERVLRITENKNEDIVDFNDPLFKFIGSSNDPDSLKHAQAGWQLAHICLAVRNARNGDSDFITQSHPQYVAGFRLAAAHDYKEAANILMSKGHDRLAKQMAQISDDIIKTNQGPARSPKIFASDVLGERHIDPSRHVISLGPAAADGQQPLNFHQTLIRLYHLAAPPANTPTAQTHSPPKYQP